MLKISFISLYGVISVVIFPNSNIFLCIPASATDAAAVYPKVIKTLLENGLITLFISSNSVFGNGPSNLPRNPTDYIVLDNWVFDSQLSVDKWFEIALRRFGTCLLVDNNYQGN